jgi:hypothetical protein
VLPLYWRFYTEGSAAKQILLADSIASDVGSAVPGYREVA